MNYSCSRFMSLRWKKVMHTARCGRVTLIHTLPYLSHASHMGGHLSNLLSYANIRTCTHMHTERCEPLPSHSSSAQTVESLPEPVLTKVCSDGKYTLFSSGSSVCLCWLLLTKKKRHVSANDGVHAPRCHL